VVAAGQSVVRVAQLGAREVLVNVPERAVAQLKTTSAFLVAFDALPGKYVRATLRELSPAADSASRTYAARLSLLDAGDEVKLGMSATVRSELSAAKAIVIPNSALYTRDNATRVWLFDRASESVKPTEIKLGASTNDGVTVASGLKAGDLVVTAGANLLQPGQKVRLIETVAAAQQLPPTSAPDKSATPEKTSISNPTTKVSSSSTNRATTEKAQ
jgi:membrane fusion protein, multidrug efflux system